MYCTPKVGHKTFGVLYVYIIHLKRSFAPMYTYGCFGCGISAGGFLWGLFRLRIPPVAQIAEFAADLLDLRAVG